MPNVTFLNIPILINQGFPVRRMIGIKAHLNLLPVILLLTGSGSIKGTEARGACHSTETKCQRRSDQDRENRHGSVFQNPRSQFFNVDTTSEITFGNHPVMENAGKNFIFSYKNGAEILHQLDLYELKDLHPMSLSGGQKQRVAIATALAADKELLIFDEPTSGLDYRHMLQVANILKKLQALGKSVYVITHDAELIMSCCTEMIRMS